MKDKKSFGKYISEKRKESNLTQEELANELYVIPTTISKWERGVSYPDITIITKLCKILNISEHEFFIACDDEDYNQEKIEIKRYKTLKRVLFYCTNIGYILGTIICFICNLALDHKLSWFYIVLVSIGVSFSITTLPFYFKRNKYLCLKVASIFMILVYLLLFTINFILNRNWLFESIMIATVLFLFLISNILLCTFSKIDNKFKISISLFLWAICTMFANPFISIILNISNNDSNFGNVIVSIIMCIIALTIMQKKGVDKKDKIML